MDTEDVGLQVALLGGAVRAEPALEWLLSCRKKKVERETRLNGDVVCMLSSFHLQLDWENSPSYIIITYLGHNYLRLEVNRAECI